MPLIPLFSAGNVDYTASATDPQNLLDAVVLDRTLAAATDTLGLLDSTSLDRTPAAATDTLGLLDSTAQIISAQQSAADTANLTDLVTYTWGEDAGTDTLGLTDSASQVISAQQSATDTLGLLDSISLSVQQSATDTLGLTDSASQVISAQQSATDTLGLTDLVTYTWGEDAGTDTLGLTDVASRILALQRTPSRNLFDPAIISTSFEDSTTLGWANRANVASLTSVVGNAQHGSRSMQVTAAAAGGMQFITTGFHPCTYGQYHALSFYAVGGYAFQAWIDWYDASGNYLNYNGVYLGAPAGGAQRFAWEAITPVAGATQFKTYIEALSLPAGGSVHVDALQWEQAYYATPYTSDADPLGLTDAVSFDRSIAITDTVGVTDAAVISQSKFSADLLGLIDSTATALDAARTFAVETVGLLDTASAALTFSRTPTDTLGLSDTSIQDRDLVLNRNLFDSTLISTSFEDSTTTGWGNYNNVASLTSVASNASHGARSMQITGADAGNVTTSTTVFSSSTPGAVYSFGFNAVSALSFQLFVYWHTEALVYLSASSASLGAPAGGNGRLVFNNVTAPATATKFFIAITALSVPASGTFNIDAVQWELGAAGTPYTNGTDTLSLFDSVTADLTSGSTSYTPSATDTLSLTDVIAGDRTTAAADTLALTDASSQVRDLVLNRNLFDPALINTSFEDGSTLGWFEYANTAAISSVVGNSGHGTRSMLVSSTAGGTAGVGTYEFSPSSPGIGYWFSFYAVSSLSFQVFINWYDSSGTYLSSSGAGVGAPPDSAGRLSSYQTAPASATQFKMSVEALSVPANGSVNLDAFQYEVGIGGSIATPYTPGTDTLGFVDTTSLTRGLTAAADTLGLLDTTSQVLAAQRTAADTVGLTDLVTYSWGEDAGTDTLGLTDSASQVISAQQSATDTLGLLDSISLSVQQSATDTLGLTDSASQVISAQQSATDTLGLTDLVTYTWGEDAGTDTLGLQDSMSQVANLQRTPSRNLFDQSVISTSFEDGTTTGWVARTNVFSLSTLVNNAATHGTRVMRVAATGAGGTVGFITSGFHPCTAGLPYSISFDVNTTLAVQVFVDWYNMSGTYLSTNGINLGAPAGGSQRLSYNNVAAPANATQFKMYVETLLAPANDITYFDAFQYEQATAATPYADSADTLTLTDSVALDRSPTASDTLGLSDTAIRFLVTQRTQADTLDLLDPVALDRTVAVAGATAASGSSVATSVDTSSYTTGALVPTDGALLVAFVMASDTVAAGSFSTSAGVTFTKITSTTRGGTDTLYVFVADARATAVSQTFNFDCTGDFATGVVAFIAQVSGQVKTGASAVRQFAVQTDGADSTTPAVTFGTSVLDFNPTLGFVANVSNPATLTPPTGWVERGDQGYLLPTIGGEYVSRNDGFSGTTITWGSISSAFSAIALELDTSGDSLTLYDTTAQVLDGQRTAADSLDLLDTVSLNRTILASTDALGLLDTIGLDRALVATDVLGLTDFAVTAQTYVVSVTDTLSATDSATAALAATITDAVDLLDSASQVLQADRSQTDTAALTDNAAVTIDTTRIDSVGLTDSVSTVLQTDRSLTDSLSLTDDITAQTSSGSTVTTTDLAGLADTATVQADSSRVTADVLGLTDTVSIATFYAVSVTDTLSLSDSSATQYSNGYIVATTDLVGLTETNVIDLAAQRSSTDALLLSDSAATQALRVASDLLSLSDTTTATVAAARASSDALGITDNVTAVLSTGYARNILDVVGITDAATTQFIHVISKTDSVGLTDSIQHEVDVTASDSLGITDFENAVIGEFVLISDGVSLVDQAETTRDTQLSTFDSIGITDNVLVEYITDVVVTDLLAAIDSIDVQHVLVQLIDDVLGLADTFISNFVPGGFTARIGNTVYTARIGSTTYIAPLPV